jgi:hypothetical protein
MATTLKTGSKGDEVKALQEFLISQGYDVGKTGADGIFGSNTAAAVKKFQQDKGLSVDGIVGSQTWGAINAPVAPAPGPEPAPAPNPKSTTNPKAPSGLLEYNPQSPDAIRKQAEDRLNPLYNAEVEALNQAADRARLAYEQQIGARNELYNLQKQETQQVAGQQRQRASDQSLKRGLARSSIAMNDQARVDASENAALQNLQRGLQIDLGNIQNQITMLENQLADSLRRLDIDKAIRLQSEIDTLTRQQEDKQYQITQINNQYLQSERAFDYQKERDAIADQRWQTEFDWKKAMDQAALDLQKKKLYSSGSGGGSSSSANPPGADTSKAFAKTSKDQEMYYNRAWDYLLKYAEKNGARAALNYFQAQDLYRNNLGPFWNRIYQDLDTMARQQDAARISNMNTGMLPNDYLLNVK